MAKRTVLRVATNELPTMIDREGVPVGGARENVEIHLQLYEPLLLLRGTSLAAAGSHAGMQIRPWLADAWERSSDATVYRLALRKGVKSPYGNELTSKDVLWTWQRSLAQKTVGSWVVSNAGITSPDQVVALDDYTVEFRLPEPATILPHVLAMHPLSPIDSTEVLKHATPNDPWVLGGWLARGAAGFGAYGVDGYDDNTLVLAANPNYWRRRPAYQEVHFIAMAGEEDRIRALLQGDVDVAVRPAPVINRDGVRFVQLPSAQRTMLGVTYRRSPFNQVELRQAIAQAIPYDRIIDEAYHGFARPMTSCIASILLGYAKQKMWSYAPDAAKSIVSRYRLEQPVQLAYHASNNAFPRVAEIVSESLQAVGMPVDLLKLAPDEHAARKLDGSLDVFVDSDGPGNMDARYAIFHDVVPPADGVFDWTGYRNPEVTALVDAARTEVDDKQVRRLLKESQRIAVRDLPWIPLAQTDVVIAFSEGVRGLRWYPFPGIRYRDLRPA